MLSEDRTSTLPAPIWDATIRLICLSNWLTNHTEHGPSSEVNRFSGTQQILHILWNPKVNYRTHKSLPPVSVLSQTIPVHAPIPFLEDPF